MTDDELIDSWNKAKNYTAYRTLKQRHKGMVFSAVNRYRMANIPVSSLESEAWLLFDDAVKNYKPTAGAKFSTYLNYQLRKLDRHTKKYQNVARIPEALASRIGDFQREHANLSQQLGRKPTTGELADALDMPTKHVSRLNKSLRGDMYEGAFEGQSIQGRQIGEDWLLREVRDELTVQEKMVYDHLIGYGVPKVENKRELSKKLGISTGRISQITRSIAEKIQPHLKKYL